MECTLEQSRKLELKFLELEQNLVLLNSLFSLQGNNTYERLYIWAAEKDMKTVLIISVIALSSREIKA